MALTKIPKEMISEDIATQAELNTHTADLANPHAVTKAQVGLSAADNTADSAKPVSTLQAAADATVQAYAIQRTNHTGTQTASTISDFATSVSSTAALKANNLSDLASLPTARTNLSINNVDNTSDATKNAASATLTNKTIDADSNTISNIANSQIKAAAGIALNKLAATTVSRALVSDASGFVTASAATAVEAGYLSGVTSAIQTQLNSKTGVGAVQTKTGAYSALVTDDRINCSGAAFTITLYAASGNAGKTITVTKTDASFTNIITIDGNASETINGALTTTLNTQYESVTLFCDGSSWFIMSSNQGVIAVYETAAGQSIPNAADTIIDFGTKILDNQGRVTTGAAWKFTANISGTYEVSGMYELTNTGGWNIGEEAYLVLYKNGSSVCRLGANVATAAHSTYVPVNAQSRQIYLNAGDYIDFRAFQNSGAAIALLAFAQVNWISIKREGN